MKPDLDFEFKKLTVEFQQFYRLLEDKSDYRLIIKYNRLNNKWRGMGGLNEFELFADKFLRLQDECLEKAKKLHYVSSHPGCQKIDEEVDFMKTVKQKND